MSYTYVVHVSTHTYEGTYLCYIHIHHQHTVVSKHVCIINSIKKLHVSNMHTVICKSVKYKLHLCLYICYMYILLKYLFHFHLSSFFFLSEYYNYIFIHYICVMCILFMLPSNKTKLFVEFDCSSSSCLRCQDYV